MVARDRERKGAGEANLSQGTPWCRRCRRGASVGGVGGGRCHQMPLWRWRHWKISSPKSSTDCSSPASVGAAARTKISRGYIHTYIHTYINTLYIYTYIHIYHCTPCRVKLADGSSDGSRRLTERDTRRSTEQLVIVGHRRSRSTRETRRGNREKRRKRGNHRGR